MRFPSDSVPPPPAAVDATEVTAKAAVKPVPRIGTGPGGPLPQGGGSAAAEALPREFYERAENDRRRMCRRLYHVPVMLDTRSGEERRKQARRTEDPPSHIAEAV
ncbi:hypothetical protein EZJ19_09365 [Parasulfuritortus cantonensis]|uniref:Uncharacterized protein n=1 Tax=Parasulfuritortus cantonensis TaxID=2528202 RepID=A0A4R1BCD9_9PROT|nr:hypothetical protein [Parasulfuritortus cantonensis]TCJ14647.1 hypothetical protein EZJ19_09365 [Parasulfuritortus cantonensis]